MERHLASSSTGPPPRMNATQPVRRRKFNSIIDLNIRRSTGAISSTEYKRLATINELQYLTHSYEHRSMPTYDIDRYLDVEAAQDDILGLEVDPRESNCLLCITHGKSVIIFDVSSLSSLSDSKIFQPLAQLPIPLVSPTLRANPNSTHWLWDSTIFTVGTINSVSFWDSTSCENIETIDTCTDMLNHVIAATNFSANKYVAATGIEGHVFMIDMLSGNVVMTMRNVEKTPIRAIKWHPINELQYVTGNDNGNICLWDTRFQQDYVYKFGSDRSFSEVRSHLHPVIGLCFYNNGTGVISVDKMGNIKTWEVSTGCMRPNYYDPVCLSDFNKAQSLRAYQFAITENLKQDIVFMPSDKGMRIIDINSCENLPFSTDVNLPLNCATYDKKKLCVYGTNDDVVKIWLPNRGILDIYDT